MLLTEIANFPICTDTRTLKPGDVFLALVGENFDGHEFLEAAAEKGAIAAVVSKQIKTTIPLIVVDNTLEAFMQLALWHRQKFNIPVIALTGSCGKTTTKEMLAAIFSQCGQTLFTHENLNNNIGVAKVLLQLSAEHQYAIIEMGSNAFGEIKRSAKATCPTTSLITNAEAVHLENFIDIDGVAKEKGSILHDLGVGSFAILNADDKHFSYWQNLSGAKVVSFGIKNSADVFATDITVGSDGLPSFHLFTPIGETYIKLPIVGEHNVMNSLAAGATAISANLSLAAIKHGLENVKPVAHRLIKKVGLNNSAIIDDSYSGTPIAMEAALKVLSLVHGTKIFIVADMKELGANPERLHHELGLKAKQYGVDQIFALGNLTRITVEAFGTGGHFFNDRAELLDEVKKILNPEVTVLVKGSHSNKLWEIVEQLVADNNYKL
jgi:UDP-N-acetylmuramoyl-tripeptide--D-alanyl-D-alanine ligase